MEAFLTNCNAQELLEKILAAYHEPMILNSVLETAKRQEAAEKISQLAKSEMELRNSDSDYSNKVLFLAENLRPENEHGSEFTSIRKADDQYRNHDEPASSH